MNKKDDRQNADERPNYGNLGIFPVNEFDNFADGYDAGMSDPVKQLFGKSEEAFIYAKAVWLRNYLVRHHVSILNIVQKPKVLDYGCGTGLFLSVLKKINFKADLFGCDVSHKMLHEATLRWQGSPPPKLNLLDSEVLPYENDTFDLVIACCVFHHIPSSFRSNVCEEIARVIKPNGMFFIFEHNPLNPITTWIVGRAAVDANAELLKASEAKNLLSASGFKDPGVQYLLFFPPRWPSLNSLERLFKFIPLGAQWVAFGRR